MKIQYINHLNMIQAIYCSLIVSPFQRHIGAKKRRLENRFLRLFDGIFDGRGRSVL